MILKYLFVIIILSSCVQSSRNDEKFTEEVAKKLKSHNKVERNRVYFLHGAMSEEIRMKKNSKNFNSLDSIKGNIDSLVNIMVDFNKKIDNITETESLMKSSKLWSTRFNGFKLKEVGLDSSYDQYPAAIAKEFVKYDVIHCTYQNLYAYALLIE